MAILKTANQFQVTALHDLLSSYITRNPAPSITLKVAVSQRESQANNES